MSQWLIDWGWMVLKMNSLCFFVCVFWVMNNWNLRSVPGARAGEGNLVSNQSESCRREPLMSPSPSKRQAAIGCKVWGTGKTDRCLQGKAKPAWWVEVTVNVNYTKTFLFSSWFNTHCAVCFLYQLYLGLGNNPYQYLSEKRSPWYWSSRLAEWGDSTWIESLQSWLFTLWFHLMEATFKYRLKLKYLCDKPPK